MEPKAERASRAEPTGGGRKPATGRPSARPDVSFTPVDNGMDYLVSVFKHLTEGSDPPSARDLKYAVLHLQAATEVLLKARLAAEHYSLIFAEPGTASFETWEKGDFQSCGSLEAIDRLRNIARLPITDGQRAMVKELGKTRNALQHYGLTFNAYAMEARAVKVLDFLITFIHEHLIPKLALDEGSAVGHTMDTLRLKLRGVQTLVKQRMNGLRSELAKVASHTVACPDCDQWAMVADGADPRCLFCHQVWDDGAEAAAADYAWSTLGLDPHSVGQDGGAHPVVECPDCGLHALVPSAETVAGGPRPAPLCFSCGRVFDGLVDCDGLCGAVLNITPGDQDSIPVCSECLSVRLDRF
ncbi:hypothetical protein JI76_37840 (plasmid) [Streptomyces anulatus]|nr:hypothetical protein JI76_37840 [Streptomyces anulatus]